MQYQKKLCNYLLKFAHLARPAAPGPAITAAAAPRAAAEGPVPRAQCSGHYSCVQVSLPGSEVECTYSTLYWHVWTTNFNFKASLPVESCSKGQCKLLFLCWQVVLKLLLTSSGWSDSVATFKVALEIRLSFSSTALSSRVSVKKHESA